MKNPYKSSSTTECEILKENACTAWVDAHQLLGTTSAEFCMNLAIEKAKNAGMGMVVRNPSKIFITSSLIFSKPVQGRALPG